MAIGKYAEWLEPDGLTKLEGWARKGLTEAQICKNMGITVQTLGSWKKVHPSILQALKRGKEVVDLEVENALLKSAMGFSYEEVTQELVTDARGNSTMKETKRVVKTVAPNTTAQIFWLKNRNQADWRDKRETELSGTEGGVIKVVLTDG